MATNLCSYNSVGKPVVPTLAIVRTICKLEIVLDNVLNSKWDDALLACTLFNCFPCLDQLASGVTHISDLCENCPIYKAAVIGGTRFSSCRCYAKGSVYSKILFAVSERKRGASIVLLTAYMSYLWTVEDILYAYRKYILEVCRPFVTRRHPKRKIFGSFKRGQWERAKEKIRKNELRVPLEYKKHFRNGFGQ